MQTQFTVPWRFVVVCLLGTACEVDAFVGTTDSPTAAEPIEEDEELPCHVASSDDGVIFAPTGDFEAPRSAEAPEIDGCSRDAVWATQNWRSLNYTWMGSPPEPSDYSGLFKLAWTPERLYILVEVVDDVLHPTLADGLENYWKGDYVEVFLDADRSGGDHRYNHQAFAYHVSTEGHAIDKNTAQETAFFDDHVEVRRTVQGDRYVWEMAVDVYGDDFDETQEDNVPVTLSANETIGFSLAYGDNDGNETRENFVGSRETHGVNNDEGYINADVFGSINLTE